MYERLLQHININNIAVEEQFVFRPATSTDKADLHVKYKNKEIANTYNTKFFGLTLDNKFSWKNHIAIIVHKLSSACFSQSC
jgi:hypothetical protein